VHEHNSNDIIIGALNNWA